MLIFFDLEGAVLFFQLYANVYVHIYIVFFVFIVLYIAVAELANAFYKFTLAVNKYQFFQFAVFIYTAKKADVVFCSYPKVIGTKIGRRVNDTGTIFSSNKIAQ